MGGWGRVAFHDCATKERATSTMRLAAADGKGVRQQKVSTGCGGV